MPIRPFSVLLLFIVTLCAGQLAIAQTESHRATRLGNPATRFADPVKTPEDLRRTLLKESLQADIQKVLRMSDYLGDMEDFRHAAQNAEIHELSIPVGTLLPAMSTRTKGKADLLRNVLWAGKKPIDAYEFTFISGDRRYRVVTPKVCSNFWVEEKLPRPMPELTLSCEAPLQSPVHKPFSVCNTLSNQGELTEQLAMLTLPIPAGATVASVSPAAGSMDATEITWTFDQFAPGASQTVCATFAPTLPGQSVARSAAIGKRATPVASRCETQVFGLPAVLLEVVDLNDPVMVGDDVVYLIRVLNQGTIPLTNIKIVAGTEDGQRFLSGDGASVVVLSEGELITPELIPQLDPGQEVAWRITVKAEQAGDLRFNVGLHADQFGRVIMETEATFQYR
jgi:hypothetical protein